MSNRTDTNHKTQDNKKPLDHKSSLITNHQKMEETQSKLANNNYSGKKIISYLKQLKLNPKGIIVSVAISTIPVLGLGILTYGFGSRLINEQIIKNQEQEAINLGDTINRFILARYTDIQILANLPFLTNQQVSQSTSIREKQALLNQFIKTYQVYDHLAVFDLNGRMILQSQGGISSDEKELKYFQDVLKINAPVISQPETLNNNTVVIYVAAPVKDIVTGERIAIVRSRVSINKLMTSIKDSVDNNDDYYLIDNEKKLFLSHRQDLIGESPTVIYPNLAEVINQNNDGNDADIATVYQSTQLVTSLPVKTPENLPDLNWQLIMAQDSLTAFEPQRQFLKLIANISALVALLMTLLLVWLTKGISKENLFNSVINGNLNKQEEKLNTELETEDKTDKLQIYEQSVSEQERQQKEEQSSANLSLQLRKLIQQIENVNNGDLTVRTDVADVKDGELATIAQVFNSVLASLREIVIQIQDNADKVNRDAEVNEDAINYLSEARIRQTEEINHTLATVEKMNTSLQDLANQSQEITSVANHTNQTVAESEKVMISTVENIIIWQQTVDDTTQKVKQLGESSAQISRVVTLINQITNETNLLAINAGIEAARAGEEGQGFAIVAEEVGELAARSTVAIQEIEQIVEKIKRDTNEMLQAMEIGSNQVKESTEMMTDAQVSLSELVNLSEQIQTFLHSVSTASVEQVETSQVVHKLLQSIALIAEKTQVSSEHISESLRKVVETYQDLENKADHFKVN
jgi:twitching motility protein PilJ